MSMYFFFLIICHAKCMLTSVSYMIYRNKSKMLIFRIFLSQLPGIQFESSIFYGLSGSTRVIVII